MNPVTHALLAELNTKRQGLLEELAVTLDARISGRILELKDVMRMVDEI